MIKLREYRKNGTIYCLQIYIPQKVLSFLYCTCYCPHNEWAWGRKRRGLCREQQTHPGWATRPPGCHLYHRPSAAPLQPQPTFAAHEQLISGNQFISRNVLTHDPFQLSSNTPPCILSQEVTEVFLLSVGDVDGHYVLGLAPLTTDSSIYTLQVPQLMMESAKKSSLTTGITEHWIQCAAVIPCTVYFKLSPSLSSSWVCPVSAGSGFSAGLLQPCRWLAESRLETETIENVFWTWATEKWMFSRKQVSGKICTLSFWKIIPLCLEIIGSGVNCNNCQTTFST